MLPAPASRALTVWIAIAAFLMAALAPSLSYAFAHAAVAAVPADVCSVDSSVRGDGETPPATRGAHPLEHCPYCTVHANGVAMPTDASGQTSLRGDLGDALPVAFLSAPRTLHAWVSAQPRAPPRFV